MGKWASDNPKLVFLLVSGGIFIISMTVGHFQPNTKVFFGLVLFSAVVTIIKDGWKLLGKGLWWGLCKLGGAIPGPVWIGAAFFLIGGTLFNGVFSGFIKQSNGDVPWGLATIGIVLVIAALIYPIALSIYGKKKD